MSNHKKNSTPSGRMGTRSISAPEKTPDKTPLKTPKGPAAASAEHELLSIIKELSGKVDSLGKKMDSVQNDIKEFNESVNYATEQAEEALTKVTALEQVIQQQNLSIDQYKKAAIESAIKYNKLHEKYLELETYNRRENLVFHGIPQPEKETCSITLKKHLRDDLRINPAVVDAMKFQRCHRLPSKVKPAPIICRFTDYTDREQVWSERIKLKDTNMRISENFPDEIRNRRTTLYPYMVAAIKLNKKAILQYDKLKVDGKLYTVDTIDALALELGPEDINTKTEKNVTCFFGAASPLSNFHYAKFEYDGVKFNCVEEVLQLKKASFAERPDVIQQMMTASRPSEFKYLGDSIKLDPKQWLPEAKRIVYEACREKFTQNKHCRSILLKSKDTILAEAGPDKTWGTGFKIPEANAFDPEKWVGENLLGKILMKIRKEILDELN